MTHQCQPHGLLELIREMQVCLNTDMTSLCVMQMGQYDKMSDMCQIGLMIDSLPVRKPDALNMFVDLLLAKQLSALDALQHPWIVQR